MAGRSAALLITFFAAFCSWYHVEANDGGTICGLARCSRLSDWSDACGVSCDENDACDSFAECTSDGPNRGGCDGTLEYCVTADYDERLKGDEYCDCVIERIIDAIEDCFSSTSTVQVENEGTQLIKDLQVGQSVLTGSGEYKPVYTIDHKNPEKPARFLQIHSTGNDSPLEMTESHMVFLYGQEDPVPASAVKVGDTLRTVGEFRSVVTDISTIKRSGIWNPITTDGTIVVDGIVASTYSIPFKNNNNEGTHVEVAGMKLVSHHDFLHLLMSPYRAVCLGLSLSLCESKDEYNIYSWFGTVIMKFYHQQDQVGQNLIVFIFLAAFKLIGFIMNPCMLIAFLAGIYYRMSVQKKKNAPNAIHG